MVDIMSTCIELAGAEYPVTFNGKGIEPNEGTSLVPTIKGGRQDPDRVYYFKHGTTDAVIKGDWKVIRESRGRKPWELHNTANDKTEMTNLAEKMPEKVKELAGLWEAKYGAKPKK